MLLGIRAAGPTDQMEVSTVHPPKAAKIIGLELPSSKRQIISELDAWQWNR